jgi:hypothetical protein
MTDVDFFVSFVLFVDDGFFMLTYYQLSQQHRNNTRQKNPIKSTRTAD